MGRSGADRGLMGEGVVRHGLLLPLLPLLGCNAREESLLGGDPPPPPVQVRFELQNSSGRTLVLKLFPAGTYDKDWVTVSDSKGLVPRAIDACSAECGTGFKAAPCPLPTAEQMELAPGATASATWDGNTFLTAASGGCLERVQVSERRLKAELCWGHLDSGGQYAEEGCVEKSFELGVDSVVRHEVKPRPYSANFILENAGTSTLYVQAHRDCSAEEAWLRLSEESVPILLAVNCTVCVCSDLPCALCDALCLPGAVQALAPGAVLERSWSGPYWRADKHGHNLMCYDQHQPEGLSFEATFCWGTAFQEVNGQQELIDERCETRSFIAEGEVEVRVRARP